jgi:hypothetical protein
VEAPDQVGDGGVVDTEAGKGGQAAEGEVPDDLDELLVSWRVAMASSRTGSGGAGTSSVAVRRRSREDAPTASWNPPASSTPQ